MKQWFKRITGIADIEAAAAAAAAAERARIQEEAKLKEIKKQQKTATLTPKDRATAAQEPYIEITKVDIDEKDPSYGSFELDWNVYFVNKLRSMGYPGDSDEIVVDLWFQSVCRNILMETYEQDVANRGDNVRYINRRDLGDGKTEVS